MLDQLKTYTITEFHLAALRNQARRCSKSKEPKVAQQARLMLVELKAIAKTEQVERDPKTIKEALETC